MLEELKEYKEHWFLLLCGLVGAFVDGLVIAQAWDWFTSHGPRALSIWLLM